MNYVTNTFLLVSSSVRSKQLCFVHGQGQKREQKPTTKKVVGFHNHSPLLTMFQATSHALVYKPWSITTTIVSRDSLLLISSVCINVSKTVAKSVTGAFMVGRYWITSAETVTSSLVKPSPARRLLVICQPCKDPYQVRGSSSFAGLPAVGVWSSLVTRGIHTTGTMISLVWLHHGCDWKALYKLLAWPFRIAHYHHLWYQHLSSDVLFLV